MNINRCWNGHIGQLFSWRDKYLCVCPICCKDYARAFMLGQFQNDGCATKSEAIEKWNQNNP